MIINYSLIRRQSVAWAKRKGARDARGVKCRTNARIGEQRSWPARYLLSEVVQARELLTGQTTDRNSMEHKEKKKALCLVLSEGTHARSSLSLPLGLPLSRYPLGITPPRPTFPTHPSNPLPFHLAFNPNPPTPHTGKPQTLFIFVTCGELQTSRCD